MIIIFLGYFTFEFTRFYCGFRYSKNPLIEMVLLRTHNLCFGFSEIRNRPLSTIKPCIKIVCLPYAPNSLKMSTTIRILWPFEQQQKIILILDIFFLCFI